MDIEDVVTAHFFFNLTDGFEERQTFNITNGTADFRNDYVRVVIIADAIDAVLYFICNVGNDLNRMTEIITATFFLKNRQ